jgi:hypothetical protein
VTGEAVARTRGGPRSGSRRGGRYYGGGVYPYGYGGFYPWGYGGFGLGGYYGYYDPWFTPWYGGGFYYPQYYPSGYYGYDGQRIEPGPHRIEIRADGYETLSFEVRVLPDRTFTYDGDLKRIP